MRIGLGINLWKIVNYILDKNDPIAAFAGQGKTTVTKVILCHVPHEYPNSPVQAFKPRKKDNLEIISGKIFSTVERILFTLIFLFFCNHRIRM